MIDIDIEQSLGGFELAVAFRAEAPVVGLFGRSGSGKTSVVNAFAGISRPRRGHITVNGEALFDSARDYLTQIDSYKKFQGKPTSRRGGES